MLSKEITELEKSVKGYGQGRKSAGKFIAMIDKYQDFDTMTTTMLNEFVEKILVHERDQKGRQDTGQEVEIYFNFVGKYIPPALKEAEPALEELEALRQKEEHRERAHRAEDMAEGIYAPVGKLPRQEPQRAAQVEIVRRKLR